MDQSYVRTLVNYPHHLKIDVEIADEFLSRIDTDANLKHTYWNAHHFSEGINLLLRMQQNFSTSGTGRWESGQSIVNMTLLQLVPWNVRSIKVLSDVNQHASHLSLHSVHGWVVYSPLWPCNVKQYQPTGFSQWIQATMKNGGHCIKKNKTVMHADPLMVALHCAQEPFLDEPCWSLGKQPACCHAVLELGLHGFWSWPWRDWSKRYCVNWDDYWSTWIYIYIYFLSIYIYIYLYVYIYIYLYVYIYIYIVYFTNIYIYNMHGQIKIIRIRIKLDIAPQSQHIWATDDGCPTQCKL